MVHYRYPRFVEKHTIAVIADEERERKYLLRLELKNRGSEKLLIIMDSMGTADELYCDRKLHRILRYIKESRELMEIGEIYITSLFPVCSSKIKYVMDKLYEKGPDYILGIDQTLIYKDKSFDNYQLIKELITESEKIILAWGSCISSLKKYHMKGADEIVSFMRYDIGKIDKVYTVGDKLLRGFPKSPLCWSFADSLRPFFEEVKS
ncbi:DUF1643 domain-containing protein [Alloiococcus sp. CFN-8]|uniref:DUF1643 domain-containing protein n=1 Tax=Alloiococcus sp. CFN-8 TaxID=3416081 RepID=UPI003CEE40DA